MDMFDNLSLGRILADDTEDNTPACPFPKGRFPEDTPLAMAYVPFQMWEKPYEADVGLSRGTIFPSLDKPFIGEEAVRMPILSEKESFLERYRRAALPL